MRALSSSEVEFFHREGYLIVPDVFVPADLQPLRKEMEDIVDRRARQLRAEGKLLDLRAGADFDHRLAHIYDDSPDNGLDIIRELEGRAGGGHKGIEMFRAITHPRLLKVVEGLTGPEIIGSSVYRIRPKLPGIQRGVVPWHQDSGYFAERCDRHLILTVWIPLVDATLRNGCMSILPGAHRRGILTHHTGGNAGFLVIQDEDLPVVPQPPVVAEVPLGGAVLMTNLTPHCSTENHSDGIRWSIDLRYQGADTPNNAGLWPAEELREDDPRLAEYQVACYPPEADFVVQSRLHPERVADFDAFIRRRDAFDRARNIAYPRRGWAPLTAA
jgi:hypothetical protein